MIYSKEIQDELYKHAKQVMNMLEEYGGSIVPHLVDTDENPGEFLRQAIAKAEKERSILRKEYCCVHCGNWNLQSTGPCMHCDKEIRE